MSTASAAVVTVIKMIEDLPEATQDQVVEHLREYIADLQDELQWDMAFEKRQSQLIAAARRARQEIVAGSAEAMDYDQL
jgi:hypothetical protein